VGAFGGPVTPIKGDADEHVKPPKPLSAIAKHAYVSPGREENVAWSGVAAGDTGCVYTPVPVARHDGSTTPPDRRRAHLTTYCTTGGLPVLDDAVNDTSSAPTPGDDTLLMAGSDGGTNGMVTAFDADEHTSPGATPLLATTKHTNDVPPTSPVSVPVSGAAADAGTTTLGPGDAHVGVAVVDVSTHRTR
jgi:hypothetical protein